MAEVLEGLSHRGVPVAVIRGLRSVEWIYGDGGSRPVEGHLLLVAPDERQPAALVLRGCGFSERTPGRFHRGGMAVELHTSPFGDPRDPIGDSVFKLPTVGILRRAALGRVAGAPALLLRPEDELLLMAIDAVRHSFDRLILIADLAHLIASHGTALRWDELQKRAAASGTLRLLGMALEGAGLLGVAPPSEIDFGRPVRGLKRALIRRARKLRPLPHGGEILMALSAPNLAGGLRLLFRSLRPALPSVEHPPALSEDQPPVIAGTFREDRFMRSRASVRPDAS